jgi:hypothetical protein
MSAAVRVSCAVLLALLAVLCAPAPALMGVRAAQSESTAALSARMAREGAEEAALFEQYWQSTHPVADDVSEEDSAALETILSALRKRQLSLLSLLESAKSAIHAEHGSRLTFGVGAGGCPRWDGVECNGPKSGTCGGDSCTCIGRWTGLACQTGTRTAPHCSALHSTPASPTGRVLRDECRA